MSGDRWNRVRQLHGDALDLPADQRKDFLRAQCGDDVDLFDDVWSLVAGEQEDNFLETPAVEQVATGVELGDFLLLEELGSGGTGIVFRARQKSLERDVAIKVMPRHFALNERRVARFVREAKATAKLKHPGIAPVYEVGQVGDTHFFAMEFVDGHDLARELILQSEGRAEHIPLEPPANFRYMAQLTYEVADALGFAHSNGVVHRDVKPNNILLDESGRPRVADFGIALDASLGSITVESKIEGTPHYMSPEQARAVDSPVDHRTDIYSLGVVLYELLTQAKPFDGGTSHEVIHKIIKRDAAPARSINPSIPEDLAVICAKAMEKLPEDRYGSAHALRDDLKRFLDGLPISARPPSFSQKFVRFLGGNQPAVAVVATVILALCGYVWAQRVSAREGWTLVTLEVLGGHPANVVAVPMHAFFGVSAGEGLNLGPTPISNVPIPPGAWRFFVERPGFGFAEIDRYLESGGGDLRVTARIRRTEDALSGLVLHQPGHYKTELLVNATGADPNAPWRASRMDDYSLGEHEVTFGEYRAYLRESGHPEPEFWGKAKIDVSAIADVMPVCDLTTAEARAYAEWNGQRLAYAPELTFAAGGHNHWDYPWGPDKGDYPVNLSYEKYAEYIKLGGWETFEANVLPSVSLPEGRTAKGLYHMLGNMMEITASRTSFDYKNPIGSDHSAEILFGGAWCVPHPDLNVLPNLRIAPVKGRQASTRIGLRVAKGDGHADRQ